MCPDKDGRKEVKRAAALSVVAAAVLTLIKFTVGIIDGSLAILSEGLHSGLDLFAAAITLVAVSRAAKAPDTDHQYGHGKIENFSALVQTIILWITSVWIILEAFRRIEHQVFASASILGIAVMVTSILVDYERSKVLNRTAKKHGSQALEADALHFSTDMISSAVVLIGLGFVWFGFPIADPIAAVGVAIVIVVVSYRLARRAYDELIDKAPSGIREEVEEICVQVSGVMSCERVRARMAGPYMFVDVIVIVDEGLEIRQAESIADAIEKELKTLAATVDVVVQMKSFETPNIVTEELDIYTNLTEFTRAEPSIVGVHKVRIYSRPDGTHIAADLEMHSDLTLEAAHQTSEVLEERLRERIPNVSGITFHLESVSTETTATDVTSEKPDIVNMVRDIVDNQTPAQDCHNIVVSKEAGGLVISFDCRLAGSISLTESHKVTELIERLVMKQIPGVETVIVHMEPL